MQIQKEERQGNKNKIHQRTQRKTDKCFTLRR